MYEIPNQSRPENLQWKMQWGCTFKPQNFNARIINPLFTMVDHFTYLTKLVTVELKL